ncbi:nitroreductase [Candidatus Bathyarchaeota archaeon CG07_land_8_20_14_0_80_47_9]|nr:MAG: nitroreductase [Candidatus Bathyarchaeota archaeon CG07_land_8_20_14_0_80_47_9]
MDVFEAVEKRRSIRKFKPDQVKKEDLKRILEAGRLAPSGGNRQPWFFIVVRDSGTKNALAIASNDQKFVAEADTVIVALGDSGVYPKTTTSSTRILHKQDPMIAIEHMVLAATALGYGTCWIGAFSETEVKKILKIPENLTVVALLPVGVPAENPSPRPRKPFEEIFFKDSYGTPLRL